jgi:hypothetical protein
LCAEDVADDRLEPFLKRLTGLLKHDLTQRAGQVAIARLAAALNQRLMTARKGIEWLEATGQLRVLNWNEDELTIAVGGATPDSAGTDEAAEIASGLKVLLSETAAWRQYYRRLDSTVIQEVAQRAIKDWP